MDEADIAQEYEERARQAAIASRPAAPAGESARICDECGEPIPEARRIAAPGCRRCVACQREHERARRGA